jgi:hypothetical protein
VRSGKGRRLTRGRSEFAQLSGVNFRPIGSCRVSSSRPGEQILLLRVLAAVCGFAVALGVPATAQSTAVAPSPQQPVYTLHANKRVVLTDVTVTGRKGNPIHGLNASVFQILDNGRPQDLASFEEHSGPLSNLFRRLLQNQASTATTFCSTLHRSSTFCLSIS